MSHVIACPDRGDEWLALTPADLPIGAAYEWVGLPGCGAIVLFSGTVRDHADDRPDVSSLVYEAYEAQVVPKLAEVAAELRRRWPTTGRIVLWHRVGELAVGESSVVVAVSAPHRDEAFAAARFGIDSIKASVPIWKLERWAGGEDWGLAATDITAVGVGAASGAPKAQGARPVDGAGAPSTSEELGVGAPSGAPKAQK